MRLNRFLAQCGVGSRRSSEELIVQGRIRVNGVVTRDLATRIDPARDLVQLDDQTIRPSEESIYLMLNKPAGCDVTRSDPHSDRTVFEFLPGDMPESVQAVGRLDRPTTGLLFFTNDGELAFRLMHPSHGVEKEYWVFGPQPITRAQMDQLIEGVALEDGLARALKVEPMKDPRSNKPGFKIVIGLGRKRIVRRMCEAIGYSLAHLHRHRVGPIELGTLAEGKWRRLDSAEVSALKSSVRLKSN